MPCFSCVNIMMNIRWYNLWFIYFFASSLFHTRNKLAFTQSRAVSYFFDGSGYALVKNIERRGRFSQVTRFDIEVRTPIDNGLILLMINRVSTNSTLIPCLRSPHAFLCLFCMIIVEYSIYLEIFVSLWKRNVFVCCICYCETPEGLDTKAPKSSDLLLFDLILLTHWCNQDLNEVTPLL